MDWFDTADTSMLEGYGSVSPDLVALAEGAGDSGLTAIDTGSYGNTAVYQGDDTAVLDAGAPLTPTFDASTSVAAEEGGFDLFKWGSDMLSKAQNFARDVFMNPERTVTDKAGNTTTTGGGINDLSKLILAGAIQNYGQGQVLKWQQERAEKESARNRTERREDRDERYRRTAFGTGSPQLKPRTGGLIKGGV